jgi:hypothetical protein
MYATAVQTTLILQRSAGNKLSQLHITTSSILKFPALKETVMDSCEVIYLSRLATRANKQSELSASDGADSSVAKPAHADTKVVDLHAWAAAHRPHS